MKIAVVSTVEYDKNGISCVINNLYANPEFVEEPILFVFPSVKSPELCETLTQWGHEVLISPHRLQKPISYAWYLIRLFKTRNIDLVHIQGNGSTCCLEALAARSAGVPAIAVHGHSVSCKYPLLHKTLKFFLNWLTTDCFACSPEAGKFLFGNRSCHVIANAFRVEQYRENQVIRDNLRSQYNLEGKTVLGHVGNFNPVKNQIFLLDVLQHYTSVKPNTVLILVGEGKQQAAVRQRAQELGLSRQVIFLGSRDDVHELMNMFDYFVFPSITEGLGIAPIEAQANGLPVLAAQGGIPACVQINDNFRFISLNAGAEAWSQALLEMSTERCTQGVENVKNAGYSLNEEIIRFKELLTTICKERKSQCT